MPEFPPHAKFTYYVGLDSTDAMVRPPFQTIEEALSYKETHPGTNLTMTAEWDDTIVTCRLLKEE